MVVAVHTTTSRYGGMRLSRFFSVQASTFYGWATAKPPLPTLRAANSVCSLFALGALPSPLWGGVRGGGPEVDARLLPHAPPPPQPSPHKGGGSRPRSGRERMEIAAPLLSAQRTNATTIFRTVALSGRRALNAAHPDDRRAAQACTQPWLKLAALILVVAALGLPVNDLFRYALLVIATVLVVAGMVAARLAPWLAALAAVALCVLRQILFAAPRIAEGHNVFLIDGTGDDLSVHSRESGNPRLRVPGERSETRDPETRSAAPGSPPARGRTEMGGALAAGLPRAAFQLMATEFNTI